MGEDLTPSEPKTPEASHEQILKILVGLVIGGSIICSVAISVRFGAGFLIGGIASFLNYYWLKATLRGFFGGSVEGKGAASMSVRFALRYFALGAFILVVFLTGFFPVISVIFGLSGFALAVMAEGFISIFRTAEP